MFKRISIQLTKPLCSCSKGPPLLHWKIDIRNPAKPGLQIWCSKCSIELTVPFEYFVAGFTYDEQEVHTNVEDLFRSGKLFAKETVAQKIILPSKKN